MSATKSKAAPAAKQIEDAIAVGTEAVATAFKSFDAFKGFEAFKGFKGFDAFKGYEDVVQFNKDNFDAMVKTGAIFAKGWQDMSTTVMGLAQESIEDGVAASKALLNAKTLKEIVEVQSGLAKANFDKIVTEGSRLSEVGVKLAEQAIAPINTRVTAAVEKLTKTAA